MHVNFKKYIKTLVFIILIGYAVISFIFGGIVHNQILFDTSSYSLAKPKLQSPANQDNYIPIPNIFRAKRENPKRIASSKKWACFLTANDYETKVKSDFEPRDLRLCSCMFNVDPLEIRETEVLVIGSKKKVGSRLTPLLKANNIKYGRIKNRYHVNMTDKNMTDLLALLNFKIVIDLTDDRQLNSIFNSIFSSQKVMLIRTFSKNVTDQIQYNGITVLTDKIFEPIFYPNSIHTRKNGDLNYYIFDRFVRGKITGITVNETEISYEKEQKYTSAKEVASVIFGLIKKKNRNEEKVIDLREHSKTANEIIQNHMLSKSGLSGPFDFSIEEVREHYASVVESCIIRPTTNYVYTSHVTIVSDSEKIIERYRSACQIVNDALMSFYGMTSIEFICVTSIQPDEYRSKFGWLDNLTELRKHHILMSIPLKLLEKIKKEYRITYFPEYFLRNIGLRRGRGRYLISGSSDVIMPPHFFLGLQKHLFSKSFLLRTIRSKSNLPFNSNGKLRSNSKFTFNNWFILHVKNNFFRNKIVNTVFNFGCNKPCNPRNRDCGDFQGFHRDFWYKINAYYNDHENFNVDSFLSYRLLGMFSPIIYKLMFGEIHIFHYSQSGKTPQLQNAVYCGLNVNIKEGIFRNKYNGTVNWGYPNIFMPTQYSYN
ncbi:hypothetical protein M9Y10_020336 [Tritrichomonas musculus]|uniref:Uncharacterized protein n=1 Tax=Tritrichomonas musculus TaxID=1915356 RepID=A0ABR2HFW9_9EUKA